MIFTFVEEETIEERTVMAMRIAIYSEVYVPDKNGVATHTKTLKDGLERAGHEVLVVTADKDAKRHCVDENHVLRCPAVSLKRVYGFGIAMPISPKRFRAVQAFDPDIIHVQSEFSIGLSGFSAARRLKVPLLYTVHTMYDDTYVQYIVPRPLAPAAKRLLFAYMRHLTRRADALILPSNRARQFLKGDIKADEEKFCAIPNAIDWQAFDPARFSARDILMLRSQLGIPSACNTAVYVGRLGKEKSLDVLLAWWAEAIRPEDGWQLVIVGGGPEAEALQALAGTLGIASMVCFAGAVEHEKVKRYLAIGDVFITASLSENNSISMLEAMASGLMVLQRYDEGTADQIQLGVNGGFFRDSLEMAQRLRHVGSLNADGLLAQKRRVRGSVRHLDTQEMIRRTLAAYRRVNLAPQLGPDQESEPEMVRPSPR